MITLNRRRVLLVAAVVVAAPAMTWGSGFSLFEVGSRAGAMAGAFTAVADDPSALFWNPAGMAFQTDEGTQLMFGTILVMPEQTVYGESPYPGEGYTATQIEQVFPPIHLYLGIPVNERLELSFSVYNPFGLGTWWEDDFLGRFLSKRADLMVTDLGISMAYQLSENVAFGIGVDYMIAEIELTRNVGLINPFNQRLTDVAQAHLYSEGYGNTAFAWNAGFLWKIGAGFQFGALYRSDFTIDGEGKGSFTQYGTGYPELDGLVASIFPFDENVPITTSIEFPDFWVAGVAWQNERWTLSGQYGVMGWSAFEELAIVFPENPEFSSVVREDYEDAYQYRFGAELRASQHWAFQAGYLFDETGQPVQSMSPLLADGDRTSYTVGLSYFTDRFRLDIGYEYINFGSRSTDGTSWDGFDGKYEAKAQLAGATFTVKF